MFPVRPLFMVAVTLGAAMLFSQLGSGAAHAYYSLPCADHANSNSQCLARKITLSD